MVTNIRSTPKLLILIWWGLGIHWWWLSYVNINDFFNTMPIKTLSLM